MPCFANTLLNPMPATTDLSMSSVPHCQSTRSLTRQLEQLRGLEGSWSQAG